MKVKEYMDYLSKSISDKFSPEKIIVFGSYAYGNTSEDSDIDLCIITNLYSQRKIDLIRNIRKELSSNYQYPLDILVYDADEFYERANLKTTLEYKINRDGLCIYEK